MNRECEFLECDDCFFATIIDNKQQMLVLSGTQHSIKCSSLYLNHLSEYVSMLFNMFAQQTVDTQKCLDWTLKVIAKRFQ